MVNHTVPLILVASLGIFRSTVLSRGNHIEGLDKVLCLRKTVADFGRMTIIELIIVLFMFSLFLWLNGISAQATIYFC